MAHNYDPFTKPISHIFYFKIRETEALFYQLRSEKIGKMQEDPLLGLEEAPGVWEARFAYVRGFSWYIDENCP